jgi:hypothetical protein
MHASERMFAIPAAVMHEADRMFSVEVFASQTTG